MLAACSQNTTLPAYDILAEAEPIPILTTQALASHTVMVNQSDLSLQSQGARKLDGLFVYTLTVNDFYGHPFININFVTPERHGNIWRYARGLRGTEWDVDDFDGDYYTILTGATDVRDTLISISPGLSLLMELHKTIEAIGGHGRLESIIAIDVNNFIVRDKRGQYWNIEEARLFTSEEIAFIKETYADIYENVNNAEAAETMKDKWQELIAESELQQQSYGYQLNDFADSEGNLNLQELQNFMDSRIAPQVGHQQRECWLFICSEVQWGWIPGHRQVPTHPFPNDNRRFGGFMQYPGDYYRNVSDYANNVVGNHFKTVLCTTNYNTTSPLGCGPSAFVGLLLRQYDLGHRFGQPSKEALLRYLVQPARVNGQIVNNGRPMIANYMGTCSFGGGGLTTAQHFEAGGRRFLQDHNSSLRMDYNFSHYAGNDWAAADKARLIVRNIGRNDGRENPVVVLYGIGGGELHYAPITHYRNVWQSGVTVTVKTTDHSNRFYNLSGVWGTQRGVFTLVPR